MKKYMITLEICVNDSKDLLNITRGFDNVVDGNNAELLSYGQTDTTEHYSYACWDELEYVYKLQNKKDREAFVIHEFRDFSQASLCLKDIETYEISKLDNSILCIKEKGAGKNAKK